MTAEEGAMNSVEERVVRDTLADLADAAPPAGLAQAAIRRARRTTRARAALAGVAVVAAIGVGAGVSLVATSRGPSDVATPPGGRLVVTAYSGIARPADPGSADDVSLLLDLATGEYEEVPYQRAVPSPDGARALVTEGDGSAAHPIRAGILDRASGAVRWLRSFGGYDDNPRWSPDGDRVLFSRRPKDGAGGFVLVDADSLRETFRPVPDRDLPNALGLGFVWAPDGRHVAHTLSIAAGDETRPDRVLALRFFDLDGEPVRTVATDEGAVFTGAEFSPDGARVALCQPGGTTVVVLNAASGKTLVRWPGWPTVPWTVVGWYDDARVVVRNHSNRTLVVLSTAGGDDPIVPLLPAGADASEIVLGPADGLPEASARHAF